jgi:hypothetical protein
MSIARSSHSPEFRTWWAGHTVKTHTSGTKAICHPVVGELTVAYETLALGSTPDVRIVTYLTDPHTPSADALDLLRMGRDHKDHQNPLRLIHADETTEQHSPPQTDPVNVGVVSP